MMVLVSFEREFVFHKTSKTGSTSVEMYLEPWCRPPGAAVAERTRQHRSRHGIVGARMTGRPGWLGARLAPWRNHMPAAEVRRRLGPARFDRCLKIAVVRDPFDRALSRYLWAERGRAPDPARPKALAAAFTDWLRAAPTPDDADIVHVAGTYAPEVTLRHERLPADLAALCARLQIPWQPARLPHAKRARAPGALPLHRIYTPEAASIPRARGAWMSPRFGHAPSPCPFSAEA